MSQTAKKVLLVDDDVDFLEANRLALEAQGYEVLTAGDSREGVEMAEHEQPDVIVMDLMMEKLYAGFSAVQALSSHEATANIPIIMVSSVTTDTGFRIDPCGCKPEWLRVAQFINKPVEPTALAAQVACLLDGNK
jgi:two-component system, OmpR family, alkaline phosphatase synthesis response regulator PhoP